MQRSELSQILTFINKAYLGRLKYPSGDDHEDSLLEEAWYTKLKEYDYKTAMMIVDSACKKTPDHPPSLYQIENEIKEATKPEEDQITSEEAWELALRTAVTSSYYDSDRDIFKKRQTPVKIQKAVRAMGGLEHLRVSKKENPFFRKNFIEAYDSISERIDKEPDRKLLSSVIADALHQPERKRLEGAKDDHKK